MKSQKTTLIKPKDIVRNWHELDASQYNLGRLATEVVKFLNGKHKVTYAPHQDQGDFVVITNSEKVKLSSRASKDENKKYYRYSGYSGGLKIETLATKFAKNPELVIREAVYNMLDDNRQRRLKLRRLHVVKGSTHNFPTKKK